MRDNYFSVENCNLEYAGLQPVVYALYYLPKNYHKVQFILLDLFERGLMPRRLEILDVGTAVGTVPFAAAEFLTLLQNACKLLDVEDSAFEAHYTCMEPSEGNRLAFEAIRDNPCMGDLLPPSSVRWVQVKADKDGHFLSDLPSGTCFNMVFFSNVMSEMVVYTVEERADVIEHVATRLRPDGHVVIIEPAVADMSRQMHRLQHVLQGRGFSVVMPCAGVSERCSKESAGRCWTFRAERLKAPAFMKPFATQEATREAEVSGTCVESLRWSYSVLTNGRAAQMEEPVIQRELRCETGLIRGGPRCEATVMTVVSSLPPNGRAYRVCDGWGQHGPVVAKWHNDTKFPQLAFGDSLQVDGAFVGTKFSSEGVPSGRVFHIDSDTTVRRLTDTHASPISIEHADKKWGCLEPFLLRLFGSHPFARSESEATRQLGVIASILKGADGMGIVDDDNDNHLCYQFPAMLVPGTCIVISPRRQKTRYQLSILRQLGFENVVRLNDDASDPVREKALSNLEARYYKILYATPNCLKEETFVRKLEELASDGELNMFVIDEAGCLSCWGKDFWDSYSRLRQRIEDIRAKSEPGCPIPLVELAAAAERHISAEGPEFRLHMARVYRASGDDAAATGSAMSAVRLFAENGEYEAAARCWLEIQKMGSRYLPAVLLNELGVLLPARLSALLLKCAELAVEKGIIAGSEPIIAIMETLLEQMALDLSGVTSVTQYRLLGGFLDGHDRSDLVDRLLSAAKRRGPVHAFRCAVGCGNALTSAGQGDAIQDAIETFLEDHTASLESLKSVNDDADHAEDLRWVARLSCETGRSDVAHRLWIGLWSRDMHEMSIRRILQGILEAGRGDLVTQFVREVATDGRRLRVCLSCLVRLLDHGSELSDIEVTQLSTICEELSEGDPEFLRRLAEQEAQLGLFDVASAHFSLATIGLLGSGHVGYAAETWILARRMVPGLGSLRFAADRNRKSDLSKFAIDCVANLCNAHKEDVARDLLRTHPGLVPIDDGEFWRRLPIYEVCCACVLLVDTGLLEEASVVFRHLLDSKPSPEVISTFWSRMKDTDWEPASAWTVAAVRNGDADRDEAVSFLTGLLAGPKQNSKAQVLKARLAELWQHG